MLIERDLINLPHREPKEHVGAKPGMLLLTSLHIGQVLRVEEEQSSSLNFVDKGLGFLRVLESDEVSSITYGEAANLKQE